MRHEPPPHPATRSYDGEGVTVGYDAYGCRHGPAEVPHHRADGLADEVPDVPTHVPEGLQHETHEMTRPGPAPVDRTMRRGAPDG